MTAKQWIGSLPPHWTIKRLGALGRLSKGSGGSKEDNRDCGFAVVRYGELYSKYGLFIREAHSFISPKDASRYTPLPTGSLVFAGSGEDPEEIGKAALSLLPAPVFVGGDSVIFSPFSGAVDPGYLAYVLDSKPLRSAKAMRSTGFTVVHISAGKLKTLPIPLPPLNQQRTIANYLDQETARIDALVAKQEKFIGLLRERRQAVVRIATGWGRSLPDGWKLTRLSHLFKYTGSGTTPTNEHILDAADGDVPWVTTSELREKRIEVTRRAVSFSTLGKYSALKVYPEGTLLIAMYGATIGRTGLLGVPASTNQACCALVEPVGVSVKFVEYSLIAARNWLLLEASGGGQPNINQEKVRAFRIPVPQIREQRAIIRQIDQKTSRIDALIAKAEEHISLAKERRAALITAAVTGQIDVRTAAQKAS